MKYLLVIAVGEYSDPKLGKVAFALEDANELIAAFEQHGYEKAQHFVLLNEDATKTLVESHLRRLARRLTPEDQLTVYFAGHGFSVSGHNVLAAWDTQYSEIEHTSIKLADMLKVLGEAGCSKIAMFLDACHTGVKIDSTMRGIHAELSDDELREFFSKSEYCCCFAACRSDESSYSSGKLKHGIWTYHLLEALNGTAKLALERKVLVTSNSLQNYLKKEVPRTISTTFTDGRTQTPWMFGGVSGEFIVADLSSILAARKIKPASEEVHLPRVSFKGEESLHIKRLTGFQPNHRVPKTVDRFTESFVERIGARDIEKDVDEAYSTIRDSMGYKRRDLTKSYEGSVASVVTPDFDYNVSLQQNPNAADEAMFSREITHIKNATAVLSDEFQSAFPHVFDTIEFSTTKDIDVLGLIDHLEEHEPEGIELSDYDDEGTFCEIRVQGIGGTITISADTIKVVSRTASSPRELAQLFSNTWNALAPAAPNGMLQLPDSKKPRES